jgi:hypothetical protein
MKELKRLLQMTAVALVAGSSLGLRLDLGPTRATPAIIKRSGDHGLETFGLTWDWNSESALAGGISLGNVAGALPTFTSVCPGIGGTVYLGDNCVYSDLALFDIQEGINPSWVAGNARFDLDAPWTSLSPVGQASATAASNAAADIVCDQQGVWTTGSTTDRAALQLAVWEALYNTTAGSSTLSLAGGGSINNVTSGSFPASSSATPWLGIVNASVNHAVYLPISTPASPHSPIAQEPLRTVTAVPEPTTLIAGALLLLPFGASTLRTVRKGRGGREGMRVER